MKEDVGRIKLSRFHKVHLHKSLKDHRGDLGGAGEEGKERVR